MALVELSVVEQRYRAVLEAVAGVPVTEVAARYEVSRCWPSRPGSCCCPVGALVPIMGIMTLGDGPFSVAFGNWLGRIVAPAWSVLLGTCVIVLAVGSHRVLAVIASLVGVAVAAPCVFCRAWHMGACFDDHGITVRKFLRTYRLGWHEVSRLTDGQVSVDQGRDLAWALNVVLRDGRVIKTPLGRRWKKADPEMLAVIDQVAARHSVPTELTGEPRPRSLRLSRLR
jgi:hypothetical protein